MLRLGVLAAAASVVVVVVVVVARRRKAPRLRLALWHDGASDVAALATLLDGVALVEVDATREAPDALVAAARRLDGVVVAGSAAAARSKEPGAAAFRGAVAAAFATGAPVLGLGRGHCVVAAALGGRVTPLRGGTFAGRRTVALNELGAALLGGAAGDAYDLPHDHDDCVPRLPPGAASLSSRDPVRTPFVLAAAFWRDRANALAFRGGDAGAPRPGAVTCQLAPCDAGDARAFLARCVASLWPTSHVSIR